MRSGRRKVFVAYLECESQALERPHQRRELNDNISGKAQLIVPKKMQKRGRK